MEPVSSFLALKPKTDLVDGVLTIETPWLQRLLCLGLLSRVAVVDSVRKTFCIRSRILFWKKEQTIPFAAVKRLDYSYDDSGFGTDSPWHGSHDTVEWFTIDLVLGYDSESVRLCRFIGEGSVDHGLEGWLAGDDLVDYRGDQQEASLSLVKLLQEMTGLPLV